MSKLSVLEFMHKTAEDATLQHQLEELLGVGDGNISSEGELDPAESDALKGDRAPIVTEFAAKSGFTFSVEELVTVVDAFQKHQSGEMSDTDFAKALGSETSPTEMKEGTKSSFRKLAQFLSKTYLGIDLGKKA